MTERRAIIYSIKPHRKINGTLFYCFEYFLFISQFEPEIDLVLHNCSDKCLQELLVIFNERYVFNQELIKRILLLEKLSNLHRLSYSKVLFLDVHSLELLGMMTRADIFCFSNISNNKIRYREKVIRYYGSYEYQSYDFFELLKFNFPSYRKISKSEDGVLVVKHNMDYRTVELPEKFKGRTILYKDPLVPIQSMFEQFSTLLYFQTNDLDTNNRLVPECFFYEKEVLIQKNGKPDSVLFRYEDIIQNGLEKYHLSKNDKIISDFLE